MTQDGGNVSQFPRLHSVYDQSPELVELLASMTSLLRAAERLSNQLNKATVLEPERRLLLMTKLKAIVAEASSLYLVLMNEDEDARAIRVQLETMINELNAN